MVGRLQAKKKAEEKEKSEYEQKIAQMKMYYLAAL